MKRIELTLNLEYRLIMRASTAALMTNIKKELKKQLVSDKPLSSSVGVDLGSIVWLGASADVVEAHAKNWLVMQNAFPLWKSYLDEIGNPEFVLILKEPAVKRLVIDDIVAQRVKIYGQNDDLKRTYGDLLEYYGDWTEADLRTYLDDIRTRNENKREDVD